MEMELINRQVRERTVSLDDLSEDGPYACQERFPGAAKARPLRVR